VPGSPQLLEKHKSGLEAEEKIPLIKQVLDNDHLEDVASAKATKTQRKVSPKRVTGKKLGRGGKATTTSFAPGKQRICPVVFFFSIGGTTQAVAKAIVEDLKAWQGTLSPEEADNLKKPIYHDLSEVEYDDFFISAPKDENVAYFYMFVIPTYNIDTVLDNFMEHLQETHNDFRIDTAPLFGILGYSVFGFGDKQDWPTEEEGFCSQAKEVDKWMAKLTGRKRAFPLGMGDVRSDSKERLEEWKVGIQEALVDVMSGKGLGEGVAGSGDPVESDEEDVEEEQPKSSLGDVEDLGRSYRDGTGAESGPLAIDFTTYGKPTKTVEPAPQKEMVPKTSPTYTALTKQGYTIVGSHSGVKICRWTKSALRGRGSCYKYSFYGIKSHLCMETTPSLSCSNKCVFCWRHGTNPVGTTWRWKVDPPQEIFDGVKAGHYKKIKMMKGVPGVRAERFAEAMRIKHCALSLVGEPIFYPHINEFVGMLHAERISSFLVCNAQHPDQLAALGHVTQLYVSIDASNKESLRKIDRPLHRDFWERFQRCLDILREKRFMQRTVFRLTLVKGFNIDDEVEGYADLVEKGLPCFVEVKGVTYCGTSTSSSAGLSMQNVPFYSEVSAFVVALNAALAKRGLEYGIAAEHAHSCCVLLASTRFMKEGKWHTRIDYDKFFECLESGDEFGPDDYVGDETPEWALWGNGGFDPRDERVDRKGRPKVVEKDLRGLVEI
jgi:tRNA wybutosine-synthesizing protein 1